MNERSALVAVSTLSASCKINKLHRLNAAVEFKSTPTKLFNYLDRVVEVAGNGFSFRFI